MNVSMEQAFGVVEFLALIFVVVAGLMAFRRFGDACPGAAFRTLAALSR